MEARRGSEEGRGGVNDKKNEKVHAKNKFPLQVRGTVKGAANPQKSRFCDGASTRRRKGE